MKTVYQLVNTNVTTKLTLYSKGNIIERTITEVITDFSVDNVPEASREAVKQSYEIQKSVLEQTYGDLKNKITELKGFKFDSKKDGDKYKVLAPKDGKSADEWAWINSLRDFGPKYVSDDINSHVDIDQTQGDGLKLKMDKELKQYALPAYPNVIYSQEELNKLSSIYVDINSYVTQQASKWVVEGGIEKEWDDYKATLKKMGIDDFMKIQQDAYDRYQKEVK